MVKSRARELNIGIVTVTLFLLSILLSSSLFTGDSETGEAATVTSADWGETDIQVPPPPFSEDIFPCSQCHADQEPNPQRRELEMHEDIILEHAQQNRWCLDCHDAGNRDKLHLADGELVDFKESYKLCGQCHGPKLRDWRYGIHGKRTGYWNGRKEYLLCVHCHDPHKPQFKKLNPEPPPRRPGKIKQ